MPLSLAQASIDTIGHIGKTPLVREPSHDAFDVRWLHGDLRADEFPTPSGEARVPRCWTGGRRSPQRAVRLVLVSDNYFCRSVRPGTAG